MEGAIYTTAGLLFVSFMSGLAYLAVKHHGTYTMVSAHLFYVVLGLIFGAAGVAFGVQMGAGAVRRFVAADKLAASFEATSNIQMTCFYLGFAALLFGSALWALFKVGIHIYENEPSEKIRDE